MSPDQLNPRPVVSWRDREWIIPKPNLKTEALLKAFLERQALAGIVANADLLGEDRVVAYQAVSRDCASRHYAYGRAGCVAAIVDNENFCRLLWWSITQVKSQEALSLEDMRRMWADKSADVEAAWNVATRPPPAEGNGQAGEGSESDPLVLAPLPAGVAGPGSRGAG